MRLYIEGKSFKRENYIDIAVCGFKKIFLNIILMNF